MRGINIIITILMTIGISLETSQAIADRRVKIIEMAESGQTFEFLMNPEEIASEDAENARLAVMREARLNEHRQKRKVIEMVESGQIVDFPMTPEEIAAEDAEKWRLSGLRRKSSLDDRQTVTYEIAESGARIEFPERVLEDYAMSIAKMKDP